MQLSCPTDLCTISEMQIKAKRQMAKVPVWQSVAASAAVHIAHMFPWAFVVMRINGLRALSVVHVQPQSDTAPSGSDARRALPRGLHGYSHHIELLKA